MNRSWSFIAGLLATIGFSMMGLVFIPNWQFEELKPVVDQNGVSHPTPPAGSVLLGREVYISEGCLYCHSQQVRSADFGADISRGWGTRRSVARDYIFDKPHLMGTMRTGPDLENIGARQPSRQWQYLHLYNPQITSPGSIMPEFRFLFKVVDKSGPAPAGSVDLPARDSPDQKDSYLIPTGRAEDLVDYLMSLNHSYDLPEAHQ
jgi:cytochrome c oxidase cbb3-type subunit 2